MGSKAGYCRLVSIANGGKKKSFMLTLYPWRVSLPSLPVLNWGSEPSTSLLASNSRVGRDLCGCAGCRSLLTRSRMPTSGNLIPMGREIRGAARAVWLVWAGRQGDNDAARAKSRRHVGHFWAFLGGIQDIDLVVLLLSDVAE